MTEQTRSYIEESHAIAEREREKQKKKKEMGRRKLMIRRLESMKARQTKYSKRKIGILKKANELAVLCDNDLALLMFSPTGKPTLCVGQNKDLSIVLEKLAKMSAEDREDRRCYTMKLLKKIYANSEVDPRNFSLDRNDALKLQEDKLKELKDKLTEKTKILREWKNPHNVKDIAQINIMEEHLIGTLHKLRNKKRQLIEEQQQRYDASQAIEDPLSVEHSSQVGPTGAAAP